MRINYLSFLLAAAAAVSLFSCEKQKRLSDQAFITSFTFDSSTGGNSAVISSPEILDNDSILFTVSADATGEQLSTLVPEISVSENATVSPASGETVDFSGGPVTFTVTAQDGVTAR
ncbi:MAG TPA: DUF5018 domain-containing protein, partial [Candidatus Coprenecus pullistercoris]|nr:DUF5018 domain-containing protein [Candidatus Coprenecus pullistercoris]